MSRVAPSDSLKTERPFRARSRARTVAIVGQTALSVLLVSIAATFVVSARRVTAVRLGFDPEHLVTIVASPTDYNAVTNALSSATSRRFVVGVSNSMSELAPGSAITRVAPSASANDSSVIISYNAVDTSYFRTLGVECTPRPAFLVRGSGRRRARGSRDGGHGH